MSSLFFSHVFFFFFVQTTRLWIHVCKVLMKSALCIQSVWSSSLSPPRCWCASCNSSDSWRHCMWAQLTVLLSLQFLLIMAIESWGVSPGSLPEPLWFDPHSHWLSIQRADSGKGRCARYYHCWHIYYFSPRVIPVKALMPCECLIRRRK